MEIKETKSETTVALLTTEKLASEFLIVKNELEKFDAMSKAVVVKDDESLAVAENNAAQVKTLITRTEATRKTLKAPHAEKVKSIDSYAKIISDQLTAFRLRFGLAITNYKTVQEAAKRAKLEATKKDLKIIEEEKQEEADKLTRLTNTVYAKLYGGTYLVKNEERLASGCQNINDCQVLADAILNSFPKTESFKHFPDKRDKLVHDASKLIRKHSIDLQELENDLPEMRKAAKQRINQAKLDAGIVVQQTETSLNKKIQLEKKKEITAGEKEIKEAAKGTKKILKFEVIEEEKVTREYLSVDPVKIRNWMEGKNTEIKEQLRTGTQPLSGIKFFVDEIYVAK